MGRRQKKARRTATDAVLQVVPEQHSKTTVASQSKRRRLWFGDHHRRQYSDISAEPTLLHRN